MRKGFSTGSVSAATIKASIRYYFESIKFSVIDIKMPGGETAHLDIAGLEKFEEDAGRPISRAVVVKDSGDDPDVTNGIKIYADFININENEIGGLRKCYGKLSIYNKISNLCGSNAFEGFTLILAAGKGVGIVTKPGLPVEPGHAAVNPVPFKMIELAASEELCRWMEERILDLSAISADTFISVLYIPEGKEVAKKTLNPRLGIYGGISILGTTGYVIPISTKAWLETIKTSLIFLSENKIKTCVFTPGRYSEKIAMKIFKDMPKESFIEMGDYVAYSVRKAAVFGIKKIIVVGQFGKMIKIAQGAGNTNAKYTDLNLNFLGETVRKTLIGLNGSESAGLAEKEIEYIFNLIINSNTSRQAYEYILSDKFRPFSEVIFEDILKAARENLNKMTGNNNGLDVEIVLISYKGEIIKTV